MLRTRRDSRRVSSAIVARYLSSSSLGIVPSRMPSAKPAMVVIGVFSSCETLAMNSLRRCSEASSESAMELNAETSAPTSSVRPSSFTRTEKSPCANFRLARAISSSGCAIRLDVISASSSASSMTATDAARNTHTKVYQLSTIVALSDATNT